MGLLVDGVWQDQWYDTKQSNGKFVRKESSFRNWVTADGSPGPQGDGGAEAEPDRYHLYLSYACPWAHRALIFRKLKGLEKLISISVVSPDMMNMGWEFSKFPGSIPDSINHSRFLYEVYCKADSNYSGRVTVPVLWDKKQATIVNNESSEIIRMFNSAFNEITGNKLDFYPQKLRNEIDKINAFVYDKINNGVYKAGFATTQKAYAEAVKELFTALDELEVRLAKQKYLIGDVLTEADWRLFTTLVRFDPVYVGHFKCNLRRLIDYPNLFGYTCELYQMPGIDETVNMEHIKGHYYRSHTTINPTGIVPAGPELDYTQSHGRD